MLWLYGQAMSWSHAMRPKRHGAFMGLCSPLLPYNMIDKANIMSRRPHSLFIIIPDTLFGSAGGWWGGGLWQSSFIQLCPERAGFDERNKRKRTHTDWQRGSLLTDHHCFQCFVPSEARCGLFPCRHSCAIPLYRKLPVCLHYLFPVPCGVPILVVIIISLLESECPRIDFPIQSTAVLLFTYALHYAN